MTRIGAVAVITLITAFASLTGVLRPLDTAIADFRMRLSPVEVTGDTVFVAIDDKSLKRIGIWPWPRRIHADLLDRISEADPRDVFFDIDFAFASNPADDAAFEAALDRAGGSTYLAAFAQDATARPDENAELSHNLPYSAFEALSWPVSVNVPANADGMVRHYYFSGEIDGMDMPSAASFLSGVFGPENGLFRINFALQPASIPFYSVADVLDGTVPASAFEGKSVVIGAHAVELRDNFAVPVHGIVPGPLIHILASETLSRQIIPQPTTGWFGILLLTAAIGLFEIRRRGFGHWKLMTQSVVLIGAVEVTGLWLFRSQAVLLSTGVLYPGLLIYGLWRLAKALDVSNWLIRYTRAEIGNTRRLLEQVFNDSSDMILVLDHTGAILSSSASAKQLISERGDGSQTIPRELEQAALAAIEALARGSWEPSGFQETHHGRHVFQYSVTPSELEVADRRQNGSDGPRRIATISARDVTALREKEKQLIYLSTHDERTGALRRHEFLDRLQKHMDAGNDVSVFALNLHRFKTINMTYGRDVGNLVLKEAVKRLSRTGNGLSDVVRLEGDGFAVYSVNTEDAAASVETAERIRDIIAAPYVLGTTSARVGARIGYADHKAGSKVLATDLLDYAEEALDQAQQLGGTRIHAHEPDKIERKQRARAIERAMWTAIEDEEFNLVYQPQFDMRDGRLIGVEALLRWTNPELGQVFPDEFIEIAESNGSIAEIGRWVLGRAARDAMQMPPDVSVAVNVSGLQMLDSDLVGDVQSTLRTSSLPAHRLWLELTESVFTSPSDSVVETMRDVETLGVSWALDDFGTGYSSMAYLSKLPLRKLKLDKCFVQALGTDDTDALAIVRSVRALCSGLGIELLCEGVETEEHVKILLQENCFEAQGYFYGRPQSLKDLLANHVAGGTEASAARSGL